METEATIKIWVDGERYVRTAEGNGPVNALDKALRDAIGERYPHLRDIELVNFKVRILDERKGTGAVTRVLLDASDGPTPGARSACPRTSSRRAGRRSWTRSRRACCPRAPSARAAHRRRVSDVIPLARPLDRARARRSSCSRRCAPAACRSGPRLAAVRGGASRRRSGADARVGRLERHRRAAPGHPRRGRRAGRRGRHHARSASSRPPTACSTRARGRCSATSTRARSTSTRRRPAAAVGGAHHRAAAGAHLRLPGRHAGARALGARARPVDRGGRLRGARRRARRRDARSARAAT